ncbi:hypothetical protein DL93DRAFT_2162413 [Clavulina sp. PMI_390]|nr:hypothetical protein DL93DRAFT_2162413 [Clavulina sp. PMI_390]
MADVTQLKHELKAWERNFREQNGGRNPTKEDTKKDPAIAAKYKLYRSLPKSAEAGTASESAAIPPSRPATSIPSIASKLGSTSLSSIPRGRAIESTISDTSNPFSPSKSLAHREAPARRRDVSPDSDESPSSRKAQRNPFLVSPRKASKVPATSLFSEERKRKTTFPVQRPQSRSPSPSPLPRLPRSSDNLTRPSREEEPPSKSSYEYVSPKKLQSILAAPSPTKRHIAAATSYTPRTKARKRMRGEDVPFTPSEGRRIKRSRPIEAEVDVFSGPTHSDSMDVEGDDELNELPESPIKPKRLSSNVTAGPSSLPYSPLFDDTGNGARTVATFGLPSSKRQPDRRLMLRESSVSMELQNSTSSSASQRLEDSDVETSLLPPSPPRDSHRSQTSRPNIPRKGKHKKGSGPKAGLLSEDETTSDQGEVKLSGNVAWGVRSHPIGPEDSDSEDDILSLSQNRSTSPDPEPDSDVLVEHDEVPVELRQARTTSSAPIDSDNVARETHESIAWRTFLQGHQELNTGRAAGGIWGVGEVDEEYEEDWESEPEGWNGTSDP